MEAELGQHVRSIALDPPFTREIASVGGQTVQEMLRQAAQLYVQGRFEVRHTSTAHGLTPRRMHSDGPLMWC